jgi:hypothetical protein
VTALIVRAAAAATPIELELPVREDLALSVAVMVSLPTVSNVAEKFPVPFGGSVASAGRIALLSVLVKWMVPV